MTLLREVLARKPRELWSIDPGATVYEALELMARHDIGALPVVRGNQLVGMFSERDYARRVALLGRSSRSTPVGELMSSPVVWMHPDCTLHDAMRVMTERRLRHLPLVEDDRMIGLVSIGDLVKAVMGDQRRQIAQLESYIRGAPL